MMVPFFNALVRLVFYAFLTHVLVRLRYLQKNLEELARVRAVALNHLDLWVRRGLPGLKLEYPHRLGADVVGGPNPCLLPKACKNPTEQQGARAVHARDAVAVCRFLHFLSESGPLGRETELSAAARLHLGPGTVRLELLPGTELLWVSAAQGSLHRNLVFIREFVKIRVRLGVIALHVLMRMARSFVDIFARP